MQNLLLLAGMGIFLARIKNIIFHENAFSISPVVIS
jgi:hypothetical protein